LPPFHSRSYDESMSFSETIFLFLLALIVFGPKKLPEIARQAGRLLAELRRASNEFKSQIETEIAHLEVEKSQTILPPTRPPQGAVANLSLNPAGEPIPHETPATLLAPTETTPIIAEPVPADSASMNSPTSSSAEPAAAEPVAESANVTAPQDSHV
jgi:sec-independent protein translocase protein TatB